MYTLHRRTILVKADIVVHPKWSKTVLSVHSDETFCSGKPCLSSFCVTPDATLTADYGLRYGNSRQVDF